MAETAGPGHTPPAHTAVPGGAARVLKQLATAVGAVGAAAYAMGYTVTTMHLSWWYVYNPSLVSGRYVSVGFCFLGVAAITLVPAYYLSGLVADRAKGLAKSVTPGRLLGDLAALVGLVAAMLFASVALIALLSVPPVFGGPSFESAGLSVYDVFRIFPLEMVVGWYGCLLAAAALARAVTGGRLPAFPRGGVPGRTWAGGLIAVLLVLATYRYAISVYPQIIPAVGGGQDMKVQLLFDEKDSEYIRTLMTVEDIPGGKHTKSDWVTMLEQTDKTYILLVIDPVTKERRGLELDKGLIKGTLGGEPPKPNR